MSQGTYRLAPSVPGKPGKTAVEMFQAEGPGARQGDLDSFTHFHSLSLCEPVGIPWRPRSRENDYEAFSRMRCPTAVFEAGT